MCISLLDVSADEATRYPIVRLVGLPSPVTGYGHDFKRPDLNSKRHATWCERSVSRYGRKEIRRTTSVTRSTRFRRRQKVGGENVKRSTRDELRGSTRQAYASSSPILICAV